MATRRPSAVVSELLPDEGEDSDLGDDDQPALPGAGKSWGRLVVRNCDPATRQKHPYSCALEGCSHKYTQSGCNATKVGWHICGKKGARTCPYAGAEHRACFPNMTNDRGGSSIATGSTALVEATANHSAYASVAVPTRPPTYSRNRSID